MDEMYHVYRWCKHYENGCCVRAEDNFIVENEFTGEVEEHNRFTVKEPESFYCKDWE